jgi:tetratricopeptide (TPR) repeat protein
MLATELGAGEKLRLVPADDVARMKRELHVTSSSGLARDIAINAGKNLKADMLVGGSFTTIGSGRERRLRVDVHMQELSHGEIVAEVAEVGDEQHLFELVERAGTRLREAIGVPGPSPLEESAARAALPSNRVAARLYAEGLARLRVVDAAGARDLLQQAVAAEPAFPLSHMALASTWRDLGYEEKAKAEAKKALDLSSPLSRADQLLIEGRYYQLSGDMDKAISAYRALFTLFPDSLEDGLMLAESQTWSGKAGDALVTVETLRRLPPPISQDPRIDMQQARVLSALGREGGLTYLRQAEEKARIQGAPLLAAKAQIGECITLNAAAQFEDAARACQAAYSVFVAAGNPTDTAESLRHLGDSRQSQGKLDEALGLYQQALKINQSVGDNTGVAVSVNQMAILYETRGDLSQAEKLYRQSYALFLKVGHRVNAAILAGNVAGILIQRGKLSEAEPVIERSMNLARESGSRNTQAQAHKLMADLALLRGDFERARRDIESAQVLDPQDNNVARYDALIRMSRILAAQDHLAGARSNRIEALALAEKIDAKGLTAQARLALAELDLEQQDAGEAERQIRDALAVFRSEKMRDDEVQAQAALSRCLLMQGKEQEAGAALAEGGTVAAYSQSPAVHLIFAIADGRSKAAGAAGLRSLARMQLLRSANEAGKLGFMPLQYEAQLALGELEISENAASARKDLESLEKRAREHGLELIARKAATLRQRHAG